MVVHCDSCGASFQVEEGQIGDAGLGLECTSCQHHFRVVQKIFYLVEPLSEGHGLQAKPGEAVVEEGDASETDDPFSQGAITTRPIDFAAEKEGLAPKSLASRVVQRTIHRPQGKSSSWFRPALLIALAVSLGLFWWSRVYPRRYQKTLQHIDQNYQSLKGNLQPLARAVSPEAKRFYLQGRAKAVFDSPEGYQEAIAMYERAIKMDEMYASAYGSLAEAAAELAETEQVEGNADKARDWLDETLRNSTRAITIEPHNLEALRGAAAYERLRGNFVKAQDYLQKAQNLDPKNVEVLVAFSRLYLSKEGLEDMAKDYLEKALTIDNRSIRTYRYLALTHDRLKSYSNAIEYWNKVSELNEDHPLADFEITRLTILQKAAKKNAAIENAKETAKQAKINSVSENLDPPEPKPQ